MTDFADNGYIAGAPLRPDQWRTAAPEMPDGRIIMANAAPPGFLFVKNFLPPPACAAIIADCERAAGVQHTVHDESESMTSIARAARTSEFIDVRNLSADVSSIIKHAYQDVVAPHFKVAIEWFELPEILRYRTGGEYKPHADAENWDPAAKQWRRMIDRDLSLLIYLNGEFQGGEIDFPNFGMRLKPEPGMLIAFPSDARYLHAARPVTSGVRYALVAWAATVGAPRTGQPLRPHITRL